MTTDTTTRISHDAPTPEFTRFLEWQLVSAARRHHRFAPPAGRAARFAKPAGIAALTIASMLIGAGGVTASMHLQNEQQKQSLLQQQQAEVRLAAMQLQIAERSLAEAKKKADVGLAGQDEVHTLQQALETTRIKLEIVQAAQQEIAASGKPAQDDLTAPKVGGQDFVAMRLQLDERLAALALQSASEQTDRARRRVDVGLADALEMVQANVARAKALGDMQEAQAMLELRLKFLDGAMTAQQVAREKVLRTATAQLAAAQAAVQAAEQAFAAAQARAKVGAAGEVDVLKLQVEMLTKRQELEKLRLQIEALKKELQ